MKFIDVGTLNLNQKIPNSVIGAVATVLAAHYYNHSTLNALFMECGAPGDVPEGNCEKKCIDWLKRCNEDETVIPLDVLGAVIKPFMDQKELPSLFDDPSDSNIKKGKDRIRKALESNQLIYRINGHISPSGSTTITKTLEDYLKSGDFSSIDNEFNRAVKNINSDPHASITASNSIIEATLKLYIERFNLVLPKSLNVGSLWVTVKPKLILSSDATLSDDKHKILKGISSIIDGVGAFRSHIGSAHGRGANPPDISTSEARLMVNIAHTIVIFIMELIHSK